MGRTAQRWHRRSSSSSSGSFKRRTWRCDKLGILRGTSGEQSSWQTVHKHRQRVCTTNHLNLFAHDRNLEFVRLNKQITALRSADSLLALMESRGDEFNDVNISTAIHRLGSRFTPFFENRREPEAGLRKIMGLCVLSIARGELTPRSLANVAWGLARLGVVATTLFAAIAQETPYRVFEFGPQDLANLSWAFAKADVDAPSLFEAIEAAAPAQIDEFTPQHLSSTAWAFARADAHAPALFDSIATAAVARVDAFAPIDLANIAWAFACAHERHGLEHTIVFDVIARQVPSKIHACSPQNMATIAAAFALARREALGVFELIAVEATDRIHEFNAQELAAFHCVLARVRVILQLFRRRCMLSRLPTTRRQHYSRPSAQQLRSAFLHNPCPRF